MPYYIDNINDVENINEFDNDTSFYVVNDNNIPPNEPKLGVKPKISRLKNISERDKQEIINSFYMVRNELFKESHNANSSFQ